MGDAKCLFLEALLFNCIAILLLQLLVDCCLLFTQQCVHLLQLLTNTLRLTAASVLMEGCRL